MSLRLFRPSRPLWFRVSRTLQAGGSDDAKPRWTLPEADYHKHTYQPSIPDKHFNIGHWNYAPITLWLRTRRPYMEKIIIDVADTTKGYAMAVWGPITRSADANLPGIGYKVLGFIGLLLGYNISVYKLTDNTEAFFFLEKMRLYAVGEQLAHTGFFRSESEDVENRSQEYNTTHIRLNALWEEALSDATQKRSFDALCDKLQVDEAHAPLQEVPKPISWRFNMMPYGAANPDTKTVGFSDVDSPAGSNYFLLDLGNAGDYPDRQDNKPNPIRKGRHMYAAAYLPPTK